LTDVDIATRASNRADHGDPCSTRFAAGGFDPLEVPVAEGEPVRRLLLGRPAFGAVLVFEEDVADTVLVLRRIAEGARDRNERVQARRVQPAAAVVEGNAKRPAFGVGASAHAPFRFQYDDPEAGVAGGARSRQPCRPGADNCDIEIRQMLRHRSRQLKVGPAACELRK
jgi:hypothetical protein